MSISTKLFAVSLSLLFSSATFSAENCSPSKMREIEEQATDSSPEVFINCSFSLRPQSIISKSLVFEGEDASDINVNLNNSVLWVHPNLRGTSSEKMARIQIRSKRIESGWSRPSNILIRNGTVEGGIWIYGITRGGKTPGADVVRSSSSRFGHTNRMRLNAPTDIRLRNLNIVGTGGSALYVSIGVTKVQLTHSTLSGWSKYSTVYLDAESGEHKLLNNNFEARSLQREQIAIDGSSDNEIRYNIFRNVLQGSIHIYRNCGEDGIARHNEPRRTLIERNIFLGSDSAPTRPVIYLSSRANLSNNEFCVADSNITFGSGSDNQSFAQDNTVRNNRFVAIPEKLKEGLFAIQTREGEPNTVINNKFTEKVSEFYLSNVSK